MRWAISMQIVARPLNNNAIDFSTVPHLYLQGKHNFLRPRKHVWKGVYQYVN
jgi:hypothetical protein